MELKKNPVYDLHQYRTITFSIGLIVSLTVVYLAFQWKAELITPVVCKFDNSTNEIVYTVPITEFEQSTKPKPIVVAPVQLPTEFVEVETIIDTEPEPQSQEVTDLPVQVVDVVPEPVDDNEITVVASEMPEPIGGYDGFYNYLRKTMRYPRKAQSNGTEGKVFVQFVVERDGTLSGLEVIKGIGDGCDEEAVRVLKSTTWKPGKQRARSVRVRMVLPVTFSLGKARS